MMFHYALYVSWILLWNCYAHQSYPQLSESSQSQTTTIQNHAPVTIRKEDSRDLRSSVATGLQENQFKKSSDVIASVPRVSDDTSYSLDAKYRGNISYQQKPSVMYNAKPESLNYTDNGTEKDYSISPKTNYQRIKQLDKLHSKEKKLLYKEDPKNKYEKVSESHETATAEETINDSTNDKDHFMNLKFKNKKVFTLNPDLLRTKSPSLRSVSNDDIGFNDFDDFGDSSYMRSNSSSGLMPPPSRGSVQSKAYDDPFRSYHPSSPENHRVPGRPGNRPGHRPGYRPGYRPASRPGYRPASRPGNRAPAQQPGISNPTAISCNLCTPVQQLTPVRYFIDFPSYIIARRKRAALSIPFNVN